MSPRPTEQGFSLIEALVALAILAIATVGLIRAVESHIDSTRGMELRATAMWVAENRMAELRIGDQQADAGQVPMLGRRWRVATTSRATDDPAIAAIHIDVYRADGTAALASLDGFLDIGDTVI
ncbi:type II secretion system minor pseudopilin GspI [Stakelama saccharophila]|uniref:Type II secretion system protein I n=1 Tax=Stakelama saccharophila TaxID=3075605 RepID=A0ABZ0BD40_9SPHN|nr:type II secretion system minor pseudopilin GspI [Stakelama sp. W311]WNO54788.1 type II secretion system minor pseudopilin GspI [Stakelama sp. W311]